MSRVRLILPLLLVLLAGCQAWRSPQETSPAAPQAEEQAVEQDEAIRTDEAETARKAAAEALAQGDDAAALDLYDWAFLVETNPMTQARTLYEIACLRIDPESEVHDLSAARAELNLLVSQYPIHVRAREARLFLNLINDSLEARTRADRAARELEVALGEQRALQASLKESEEELQRIKQVLLERQP